jgi:hypothetical protein
MEKGDMSDSVAFPLIISNCFVGLFLAFYVAAIAHEQAFQIVAGVERGVPISKAYRELMLYVIFVHWECGSAGASAIVVAMNLLIASNVVSEDAKHAAYLVALCHSLIILSWATIGPLQVSRFRSILCQGEAD